MADLTLTADIHDLTLTIGTESHRLPLADVGHLHQRIDAAVAEARRSYAVQKAAEERAKATAVAQAAYPGGWLLPDGRWAYVDEEGWPRCSQYAPVDGYFVVASSPATMRWRDYRGSRLHIGGGDGYVCGAWPWEPRLEPSDSTRPVCEKCVAGGA